MLTELIQNALQNDTEARKVGKQGSFTLSVDVEKVTSVVNKSSEPLDVRGAEQQAKLTVLQSECVADHAVMEEDEDAKILQHGQYYYVSYERMNVAFYCIVCYCNVRCLFFW